MAKTYNLITPIENTTEYKLGHAVGMSLVKVNTSRYIDLVAAEHDKLNNPVPWPEGFHCWAAGLKDATQLRMSRKLIKELKASVDRHA